jgi:hypothetical protein
MEDKKLDNKNKKEEKKKLKKKKGDKEDKKDEEGKKEIKLDETPKLQCLKIQVNSHITEFLYYQRYPKKNNEKYDPKLCALVYYFNENLDDKFFYLYFSLMGQIDEIFFGSFFGHNKNLKSSSNKSETTPRLIHFVIVKYLEEESLNILLDNKQAQILINNYLYNSRNVKIDLQYDLLDDEKNRDEFNEEGDKKKKNIEEDFVLVKGNTSKSNFSFGGTSFKIEKEKNEAELELEDDEENSDMPNFKKKKKKKGLGNDFYYNFQLLNKKRSVKEELEELFAKDKEVIERKKKMKQNNSN